MDMNILHIPLPANVNGYILCIQIKFDTVEELLCS